jgi:hypothetical protein
MKINAYYLAIICLVFSSCSCRDQDENSGTNPNKVLLLKVDYLTHQLESGFEFTFSQSPDNFTVTPNYAPPGDFGSIELVYDELNTPLFAGTIIWSGTGAQSFPAISDMLPASSFERTGTEDLRYPEAGFEEILNLGTPVPDFDPIWSSVQDIKLVRQYLQSNTTETVKFYAYFPAVGTSEPSLADWIILIKN